MSPPPRNTGKAPVTDDGNSSDSPSHPGDVENVNAEVVSSYVTEEEETLGLKEYIQCENLVKHDGDSPVLRRERFQESGMFDAELVRSKDNQTPSSPQIKKKKRMKKKAFFTDRQRDDGPGAVMDSPASGKNLQISPSAPWGNIKTEAMENDGTSQLEKFAVVSVPARSGRKSKSDTEDIAPNADKEAIQKNEDPTKMAQRFMVDRIMSTFMSWMDTKLEVKQEEDDESQLREALMEVTPGGGAKDDDLFGAISAMPANASRDMPSSSRHGLESFTFHQPPVPSAPAPVTGHRNSNSTLPSPPSQGFSIGGPPPLVGPPRGGPPLIEGPPLLGRPRSLCVAYRTSVGSKIDSASTPKTGASHSRFGYTPRGDFEDKETSYSSRSAGTRSIVSATPPSKPGALLGAATPAYGASASQQPPPNQQAHGARKSQAASLKGQSKRAKRSRKHDRSADGQVQDEDEDEEGDKNLMPSAKLSKIKEDAIEGAKFACPFFKHNPRKYKTQRPCCGPGWDHVHRIKEHIYRKHSLPKFSCPRCSQSFGTQLDLQAHARSPDACDVREPEVLDGITQDQEKKLRSRKKTSATELTNAEKWIQVYSIIFPDVREREIPSPYYNAEDAEVSLGGYEDYLRRELPPLVRRQLEKEVNRELSFVEESMKQKVIDIARNLQLTLFKGYQQLENQERGLQELPSVDASSNFEADESISTATSTVTSTATDTWPSTMTTSGTTPEIPDPLDIFGDPTIPDFDFNFLAEVPYPESQVPFKGQDIDLGTSQSFDIQEPVTIRPGMELLGAQQHGLLWYGVDDHHEIGSQRRDTRAIGYFP
ncbi:hypothetical protein CORC01_09744 [Colletotrichum orchidophilum]|uniref:C2H2-type domain-containing protein n=1 Tax=Colletotrichum orchidophilum TaxID=1209926 RepID=A0A1G4B0K2_9PEZI|nr:uncharacterized protein CORC01_09744 [Colletotrichum orchidophilum]OHE94950.1 hypothetical protein CORC01_09744 [Colletotrichum orchidophilum]